MIKEELFRRDDCLKPDRRLAIFPTVVARLSNINHSLFGLVICRCRVGTAQMVKQFVSTWIQKMKMQSL